MGKMWRQCEGTLCLAGYTRGCHDPVNGGARVPGFRQGGLGRAGLGLRSFAAGDWYQRDEQSHEPLEPNPGCLRVQVAIGQAFEELVLKILDSPTLMQSTGSSAPAGVKLGAAAGNQAASACSC